MLQVRKETEEDSTTCEKSGSKLLPLAGLDRISG
jgi:hypothetical protein